MAKEEDIINQLLRFGLKQNEIEGLSSQKAISYIRFYHEKKDGKVSILFRGFSKEETNGLTEIARTHNLTINSRVSNSVTFFCASEPFDLKHIETARDLGIRIYTKEDFQLIISETKSAYDLQNNEFLYDTSVPIKFRIAKPLSNFDKDFKIKSFSFESDVSYDINLFRLTCSCPDFIKKIRSQYPKGDVRRLCKHLIHEYKNSFGLYELSEFIIQVFNSGYPLKRNLREIILESYEHKIYVSFDDNNDWWAVYVQNQTGWYSRYGYTPIEKQFLHNDKPIGLVAQLKLKFKEIHKELEPIKKTKRQIKKDIDQKNQQDGCVVAIIIFVIALILSLIFK